MISKQLPKTSKSTKSNKSPAFFFKGFPEDVRFRHHTIPDSLEHAKGTLYEAWFNAIDKDRDGGMDPYELETYLTKINYKPSLVRKSDVSHVSKNSMQAGAMKAIINGIFDKYDTNKDFTLSIAEFRPFYNDLGD